MKTITATVPVALFAAIILSVMAGVHPVRAQTAACPCFTGADIDAWYTALSPSAKTKRVLACVDDPGFTTLDYLDKSASTGQVYIDVTYPTSHTSARCLVDKVAPASMNLPEVTGDISQAQADACRAEILRSRAWAALSCPNN